MIRTLLITAVLVVIAPFDPVAARAECPSLELIILGSVTTEQDSRPISNHPITIRVQVGDDENATMTWEAVVTDYLGNFRWHREFPADPCYDANPFLNFPKKIWGKLRHPRSKAYSYRARGFPSRMVLNAGGQVRRLTREDLLRDFNPTKRSARVDVKFRL